MILLADKYSNFHPDGKPVLLGKAGEKVTLISEHGDVLIVAGPRGKFPIQKDKIRQHADQITNQQDNNRGAE